MHQLLPKVAAVGFLTLLSLWILGLFVAPPPADPALVEWQAQSFNRANASQGQVANNLRALKLAAEPAPLLLERPDAEAVRIHEKSAQLTATSSTFEDDEKAIRRAIAGKEALVLNESSSGTEGKRRLALEVSVPPEKFDDLTTRLREIGRLQTVSVQQRDRTDEFRRLRAQQQRLKKLREETAKVADGKVASVEDRLRILQKLQEIDKELQGVEGQAGDLLGKESYYQVYLTLSEEQPRELITVLNSVPRRALNALAWALPWWVAAMATMALGPATYVSLRTLAARRVQQASGG